MFKTLNKLSHSRLQHALIAISITTVCLAYFLGWFDSFRPWKEVAGLEIGDSLEVRKFGADEPEIFWLGHAGFLIRWQGSTILLDPNLNSRCTFVPRLVKPFVSAASLPSIDAVLLSHAHYDHMDLPTLESIPRLRQIILPKGSEDYLSEKLRTRTTVSGLNVSDEVKIGSLLVVATPAKHNGNRNHPFTSAHHAQGYIIKNGAESIYFSGDSGFDSHIEEIALKFKPSIAILPIGGYTPYFILKNYHFSPEDAARAGRILGARRIIPAHFGTFRVALDHPSSALPRFLAACALENIGCELPVPFS